MTVTVRLKKFSIGTEINVVQEGLPDVIPPDACTLGWQESLVLLAKLVEAEIPDQAARTAVRRATARTWRTRRSTGINWPGYQPVES
jgi:hypothetical protein